MTCHRFLRLKRRVQLIACGKRKKREAGLLKKKGLSSVG
jgi:hypothetical protein